MVNVIRVCWQLVSRSICSCLQAVSKPVWQTPLLSAQWETPDDGQRNCRNRLELYTFQPVSLSIIRSFSLHTHSNGICHTGLLTACEQEHMLRSQAVTKPVRHIPLLCVQWKTPDDGQRNCPKHAEFHSKNKSDKLVHLVGFIIRNKFIHFFQIKLHV